MDYRLYTLYILYSISKDNKQYEESLYSNILLYYIFYFNFFGGLKVGGT